MKTLTDCILFLETDELSVLMQREGVAGLFCFRELTNSTPESRHFPQIISSLIQKKYLLPFSDGWKIEDSLKEILIILKNTPFSLIQSSPSGNFPESCIFFLENMVLKMEMDEFRHGGVRLELQQTKAFFQDLKDNNGLSEIDFADYGFFESGINNLDSLDKDDRVILKFTRYPRNTGKADMKIYVLRDRFFDILVLQDSIGERVFPFSAEVLFKALWQDSEADGSLDKILN